MRKPICLENKCYFSLQTSKISNWSLEFQRSFDTTKYKLSCAQMLTTVYPILTIILACNVSPLHAKAMIPNEMPDG